MNSFRVFSIFSFFFFYIKTSLSIKYIINLLSRIMLSEHDNDLQYQLMHCRNCINPKIGRFRFQFVLLEICILAVDRMKEWDWSMLMVGLTFAVIVCAGSNASGFLWEQSSLLFRSNSIRCPNRFQFKIVPCEIKRKIRDERLSCEALSHLVLFLVIISVAGSYTLEKLTRRESKSRRIRKFQREDFYFHEYFYTIEKQESFIINCKT